MHTAHSRGKECGSLHKKTAQACTCQLAALLGLPFLRAMAFDAAALSDKLRKLNASAQSVEQLSAWCVFHSRSAKQVASTWASALSAAPDAQKLAFVFLANDVVQNSRKRGPAYTDAFAPLLPGALRHVIKHAPGQETLHQLRRLVTVWEERKVFGAGKTCKELKAAVQLGDGEAQGAAPTGDAAAEAALKAVTVAHDAVRAAQAKGGPVRGARLALVAALREAADAQEALALMEPQRQQEGEGAAAGGDAGDEQEYDPADALLVQDHRTGGTGTSAAAAAAALDAFAHLPPEQREAMAAALAAAAAAAHTVEHRGANTPASLLHQPSLGAWAVRGSGAHEEAGEDEDGSRGQKRARQGEAPHNAEELHVPDHEQ